MVLGYSWSDLAISYGNVLVWLWCACCSGKASSSQAVETHQVWCVECLAANLERLPIGTKRPSLRTILVSIMGVRVHRFECTWLQQLYSLYNMAPIRRTLIDYCDLTVSSKSQVLIHLSCHLKCASSVFHHIPKKSASILSTTFWHHRLPSRRQTLFSKASHFSQRKNFPKAPRRLPLISHWTDQTLTKRMGCLDWFEWYNLIPRVVYTAAT